jgi:hypothetical protein
LLVGTGIFALTTVSKPAVASYPDAGIYSHLPDDVRADIPDAPESNEGNSLYHRISGARINVLQVGSTSSQISLGKPTSQDYALHITSDSASTPIYIETVIIDGLECTDLTVQNSEVYNLSVHDNTASGVTLSQISTSTVSNILFGSLRGVFDFGVATGPSYDRVIIDGGSVGADIKLLKIHNVQTFGAPCLIEYVKVGKMEIKNSRFGNGSGIDSPNFTVASTTSQGLGSQAPDNNTEEDVSVR